MKEKKVYKIGDILEENEILEVSKGIVKKALKVVECSGNKWATNIIEGKDREAFEDLQSIAMLEIIENDYIITKSVYKKLNNYLYNYKVDKVQNVEIVVNEESNASNVDKQAFVNYERNYNDIISKNRFNISELGLTKKQIEVLNIYSKTGNLTKTAEFLGISKQGVAKHIELIKSKAVQLINVIEY